MSLKDKIWPSQDVLAMAFSIYRSQGFRSVSFTELDSNGKPKISSKDMLFYAMVPGIAPSDYLYTFTVSDEDKQDAADAANFFSRLGFGVIADSANDYLSNVYRVTQSPEVTGKDFGVIASVPQLYEKEVGVKKIKTAAKKSVQEHLGTVGDSIELTMSVIRVKFIEKIGCFAHEGIADSGHLISFLNKKELIAENQTRRISARIKGHVSNYYSKTPETQLNYVKIIDVNLVWQ